MSLSPLIFPGTSSASATAGTAPADPLVGATANGANEVDLTIDADSAATWMTISRDGTQIYSGTPIGTLADTGLVANTTYGYIVTITNGNGTSTGTAGATTPEDPDGPPVDPPPTDPADLPEVSVVAGGDASEDGRQPGSFTVSRTGPTDLPLTVDFSLGGSAVASTQPDSAYPNGIAEDGTGYTVGGATYNGGGWEVVIPAGCAEAAVEAKPLNDAVVEGQQTIIVSIINAVNGAYQAAAGAVAQITRHDLVANFTVPTRSPSTPADAATAANLIEQLDSADPNERNAAQDQLTSLLQSHPDLATQYAQASTQASPANDDIPEIFSRLNSILSIFSASQAVTMTAAPNQLTISVAQRSDIAYDHPTIDVEENDDAVLKILPYQYEEGLGTSTTITLVPLKSGSTSVEVTVKWVDANGNPVDSVIVDVPVTITAN